MAHQVKTLSCVVGSLLTTYTQGTDPTQLISVLTDANILTDPLDSALFPGLPAGILVHDGFRNAHAITAKGILAEVKKLIASKGAKSVTTVSVSPLL